MTDSNSNNAHALIRRGFDLGDTSNIGDASNIDADATDKSSESNESWAKGEPIVLRGIAKS